MKFLFPQCHSTTFIYHSSHILAVALDWASFQDPTTCRTPREASLYIHYVILQNSLLPCFLVHSQILWLLAKLYRIPCTEYCLLLSSLQFNEA